ncbi:hypothetical protein HT031_000557 [Scenedesmus sp. PABB004]|nr:hypothetical protein HT031_000557 [Scenedesmus sp. PABB004]
MAAPLQASAGRSAGHVPRVRGSAAAAPVAREWLRQRRPVASGARPWPAQQRRCSACRAALPDAGSAVAAAAAAAPAVFEPRVDGAVLAAQLLVLAACGGAGLYWWFVLVPSARRTLARDKRTGELNEFLNELQASRDRPLERWFYTDWLRQLERRQQLAAAAAAKRAGAGGGDPQQGAAPAPAPAPAPAGEAAEGDDRQPAFWSLDNPIVATGAVLGGLAAVSALAHGP